MHAATAQGVKNYALLGAVIRHLLPWAKMLLDFGSQVQVDPAPLSKTDLGGNTISLLCPVQTVCSLTVLDGVWLMFSSSGAPGGTIARSGSMEQNLVISSVSRAGDLNLVGSTCTALLEH